MSFTFNKITFQDQFQKLQRVGDWLENMGIQVSNTRFDEVLHLNKEIVEHHRSKRIEDLIERYGNLKLWFALTEASSFIQIHEMLKTQKSHIRPRAKLKKMLYGPFHSWDEDAESGNIEPRNTLFELESAAKFREAGVKILGYDDVDFLFKKTQFNVQCKRIQSEKKIKDNVSEAAEQFYRRMKSRPNLKGIICISMDKLTGKEGMILKVTSPYDIRPKLSLISEAFLEKYRHLWHSLVNINILAVLLFVHIVAIIEEKPLGLLTTCRDIAFDIIPRRAFYQLADYDLVVELGKRLQGTADVTWKSVDH